MGNYFEIFGELPLQTRHVVDRMNEVGISPTQLSVALSSRASRGTSAGTIMFYGGGVSVVVDEITGEIVTLW